MEKNVIKKHKKYKKRRKLGFFKKLLITFGVLILIGIIALATLIGYYYPRVPQLNTMLFDYSQNAIIYDRNNQPYQNLQGEENRQNVEYGNIPPVVRNAFIAVEDKRFYSHHGIDLYGTLRAISEVFLNRNLNGSGGSTITQQLIKQTHLTSEKSIERKFDEWILAYRLENIYSKEEILTAYLNKINFHGAEGIQAAAQQYFGKDTEELDIAESAVLAAIPNSPTYFDPYTYDENKEIIRDESGKIVLNEHNKDRAFNVLDKMEAQGYISEQENNIAKDEINNSLNLVFNNPNKVYSYFTDALYEDLLEDLSEELNLSEDEVVKYINTSGLKIYSTVDANIQEILEIASSDDSLFPEQSEAAEYVSYITGTEYRPEIGMTVVNNNDGSVVGMVGGRDNNASLTLNRATSHFQTGSSTKPITTYAPALEENIITLATVYNDIPISVDNWEPKNSEGTFNGPTTVRDALIHSVNTVAVQAFMDLGLSNSLDYADMLDLTIEDADANASALALGGYTYGQTTEQMAAAYATLASGGKYTKPYLYTKVLDSEGNIVISHTTNSDYVFSPETCFLITEALKEACTIGTTNITINGTEAAGKTGTTDNLVNAWFCGYTPNYSTAIWYGYDRNIVEADGENYELDIGITGGNKVGPAGMFEVVMNEIEENTIHKVFTQPSDLVKVEIDKTSGLKATTLTDLDPRGSQRYNEYFISGTQPTKEDQTHVATSFDTVTGMRASRNCPSSNVRTLGLIDVSKIKIPNGVTPLDFTGESTTIYNILTTAPTCTTH